MKLLKEITEATVGPGPAERLGGDYRLRKSARAILLNEKGEMATQYLENHLHHKLPGGGVDPGETIEQACKREIREEVGCDCELIQNIGVVIEYRDNEHSLLHISYCYVARVVGDIGELALEEAELAEGQVTLWLPPAEVLHRMKNTDTPTEHKGKFILARETTFLEEFLQTQT